MFDSCVCVDFDGPCDVFDESYPVARKDYSCSECGEPIKKGETYQRVKMLFDGRWSQFKTCAICERIADDIFECGRPYGDLWEHVHEAFCGGWWDEDEGEGMCMCPGRS